MHSLPYRDNIFAQRFYTTGTHQAYFGVLSDEPVSWIVHPAESDNSSERLFAIGIQVLTQRLTETATTLLSQGGAEQPVNRLEPSP